MSDWMAYLCGYVCERECEKVGRGATWQNCEGSFVSQIYSSSSEADFLLTAITWTEKALLVQGHNKDLWPSSDQSNQSFYMILKTLSPSNIALILVTSVSQEKLTKHTKQTNKQTNFYNGICYAGISQRIHWDYTNNVINCTAETPKHALEYKPIKTISSAV